MGDGKAGSESVFDLIKGAANSIVQKLTSGASFEVHTAHAVAAVKGTQFEVSADEAESAVTVQEGVVSMSDPQGKRMQPVHPFQQCRASKGRLEKAFQLSKRDAGEFSRRWERARMIHGQRAEIMKAFESKRGEYRAKLAQRRPYIQKRRAEWLKSHPQMRRQIEKRAEKRKAIQEKMKKRKKLKKTEDEKEKRKNQ
jgi:hypothetical protein